MIYRTLIVTFITVSLVVLPNKPVQAQETNSRIKTLQVQTGLNYFLLKDKRASNLNYSGSGFNIGVGLLNSDAKKRNHYNLRIVFPTLTSQLENEMTGLLGEFNYQHLRKTNWSVVGGDLAIGGFVKLKSFIRTFTILNEQISGEIFSSVGPSVFWRKAIAKRHQLIIQAQNPLLAYVLDFDSFVVPKEGLVTIADFIDYDFDLQYEFSANTKASFYLHYHFNYYRIRRGIAPVKYGSSQFLVGLNIRL
ncbi:MAG: hypothetical protein NXI20_07560 [bacterium]|nr:hypothetical protein [bacterium]